mgnify:FL=1
MAYLLELSAFPGIHRQSPVCFRQRFQVHIYSVFFMVTFYFDIGSGSASGSNRSGRSKRSKDKDKYGHRSGGHSSSETESVISVQRRNNQLNSTSSDYANLPPPNSTHIGMCYTVFWFKSVIFSNA